MRPPVRSLDRRLRRGRGRPARVDKPPYAIPSMAEISAAEPCGLDVVSTFSGCGGSCLGFKMAGYRTLWASEFVDAARDVYRTNFPGVQVDERDIRDVKPEEILSAIGRERGDVDVLEGSPPCAAFSTAGKRSAKWGESTPYSETVQRSDDLFFELARIVDGVQPRVFVAENVSGLIKGVAKGYFKAILARLQACGYRVEARLLDASWLGVPQARQRLIFVGVREDLGVDPAFPAPLGYQYSIRDALPWLGYAGTKNYRPGGAPRRPRSFELTAPSPTISAQGFGSGFVSQNEVETTPPADIDAPAPTIMTHGRPGPRSHNGLRYTVVGRTGPQYGAREEPSDDPISTVWASGAERDQFVVVNADGVEFDPETGYRLTLDDHAIGVEWDKLGPGESSERYFNLVRPDADDPSPTVTASNTRRGVAGVTHPVARRKFSLVELRRLCGFPDDFILTGTYSQRWERLGRAVPPPMMRAVAAAIRDNVLSGGRDG